MTHVREAYFVSFTPLIAGFGGFSGKRLILQQLQNTPEWDFGLADAVIEIIPKLLQCFLDAEGVDQYFQIIFVVG